MEQNSENNNRSTFTKFIHQIWFDFGKSNMPDKNTYDTLHNRLAQNNLQYMYKLWTLDDATRLIDDHYPQFSFFFKSNVKYNVVKCDFFRYLLMYHFGGIYIDLDFASLKSFDSFFDDLICNKIETINLDSSLNNKNHEIILTEEWFNSMYKSNTLHNGFLISKTKGNPFWLKLLFDVANSVQKITTQNDVFEYSGTKKIYNHVISLKDILNDSITILPHYYMCPYLCIAKSNIQSVENIEFVNEKKTDISSLNTHNWVFFNIHQIRNGLVSKVCRKSYMVCICIPTGSSWR